MDIYEKTPVPILVMLPIIQKVHFCRLFQPQYNRVNLYKINMNAH